MGAKRTIPKSNKKDGNSQTASSPPTPSYQWAFQLGKTRNRCWGGELFPHKRKWIRVWMKWVEWWNYCCKYHPATVCKTAVSKSSPPSGNITAQHHIIAKPSTQNRNTRLTWHVSPRTGFILEVGVVRSEHVFLKSLRSNECLCCYSPCSLSSGLSSMCASLDLMRFSLGVFLIGGEGMRCR